MGIGLILELDWGDTGREQQLGIELLDADGRPIANPDGDPVGIAGASVSSRRPTTRRACPSPGVLRSTRACHWASASTFGG
jgi:hypothetical protein